MDCFLWFPQEHLQHLLFLPPLLLLPLLRGMNPSLRPSCLPVPTVWAGAPSSAPSSPSTKANWKNQTLLTTAAHICEKKKMLVFVLVQFVHSKSFSNLRLAVKSDYLYLNFFSVCFIHSPALFCFVLFQAARRNLNSSARTRLEHSFEWKQSLFLKYWLLKARAHNGGECGQHIYYEWKRNWILLLVHVIWIQLW